MALPVTNVSQVDQAQFDAAVDTVTQFIQSLNLNVDLKRGVFHDLILYAGAALSAANQTTIDLVQQSDSLLDVTADPTLANEDVFDRLASNYRITRIAGTTASGQANIIISQLVATTIAAGQIFEDPAGNLFVSSLAYNGRISEPEVISSTDRLITAVGDGTFSFTITLDAADIGVAGNIPRTTLLTPSGSTITNFVTAFASSDFSGGTDTESNLSMLNRIQTSIACRSLSSRTGLEALIRSTAGYELITNLSTIGFGDSEMRRAHSILPVALPGRVDSWIRVQPLWESRVLTLTAIFAGTSGPYGVWQLNITRNTAPGYYQIDKITLPPQASDPDYPSYAITSEVRGYDVSVGTTAGTMFLPDVTSATEAAYSRYQTSVVQFVDTDTSPTGKVIGVSTNDYSVVFRIMPDLDILQDLVAERGVRSLHGDCLVRGPIPCFTSVVLDVGLSAGVTITDADLQNAAADAVNSVGFTGQLPAATVAAAVRAVIPEGAILNTTTVGGTIRRANQTTLVIPATAGTLTFTSDPTNLVTSRTVSFFCLPDDVTVTTYDLPS